MKATPGTVNCTYPRRESNLGAHSRRVFVYIHDVVWAVNAVKINDLWHGKTQVMRGWNESSAGKSLGGRRQRDSLRHDFLPAVGVVV